VALVATAAVVVQLAWHRLHEPVVVRGQIVSLVGAVGLGINLVNAWMLGHGHGHNLNTRAALLHVLTDAVGSFVAIASGLLAWRFGLNRADPLLSFVMAALILFGAWNVLRRATAILMEGVPLGLDLAELARTIRATPGVADLHDLHAWTISEGFDAITVHVVLDGSCHGTDVAREVGARIRAIHRVAHVTVQPEAPVRVELRPVRSLLQRPGGNPS
jgi:cobalt-zinc-cadmium efflux system protein